MIDLHCHPLPGLDDGCPTAEDGVALLVGLARLGFSTVVATPHVRNGLWDNRLGTRRAGLEKLLPGLEKARAGGATLPTLELAGEHMFDDVLTDLLARGEALTYPGGGASLVEFSYDAIPHRVELQLWRMKRSGVRPILAHPERYAPVQADPERYEELLGAGALGVLDVMSLVGAYGRRAQACAERLVSLGRYRAACSDAHKPADLEPLSEALGVLKARVGAEGYRKLLVDGPRAILEEARSAPPGAPRRVP
ncbi:MAG: protein tyrosine phosphatase [Deltaproteobacteria bacterium]|nr:protein tyrosine phosphatase [Deltaproteobacteria bacterium]